MKKIYFLICFLSLLMFASGCSKNKDHIENVMDTSYSDTSEIGEESSLQEIEPEESRPYTLSMDYFALGAITEETVNIIILTDIEDWEYTVSAEYGTIKNANKNSFDYTRARVGNTETDTITINFADKSNKKVYTSTMPIRFLKVRKETK